jgi:hypothetical protein
MVIGLGIARALAACEKASLFPGPLSPDAAQIDEGGAVTLPAAGLVAALVGAAAPEAARGSGEISPLWTPPAQADGAVWDSAANRYALGLLLYRLIAGEHPFSGAGLRHALGEAAYREAPPFVEGVAEALPAGLQSLILRLLDPDPARRPARAEAVVEALRGFLEGAIRDRAGGEGAPAQAEEAGARRREERREALVRAAERAERRGAPGRAGDGEAARRGGLRGQLLRLAPIAAGALVALGALALIAPAPAKPERRPAIAPAQPLSPGDTAAQDCAACHARQAAEWRRSVMAHAVKSPLFNGLESLIEEQVGRDFACPNGAGILRRADPSRACRDTASGVQVTGSGGEHWCVNCHSPAENLSAAMPAWDGRAGGDPRSRHPVRDLLTDRAMEGISCGFCHEVHGPVGPRGGRGYQGNPTWTSFVTGAVFAARPEDGRGLLGIANSGYDLRPEELLLEGRATAGDDPDGPGVHRRPSVSAEAYLRSSEFCGACHDVRLFGTDSLGAARGEHFKRLRNAYSEWAAWAKGEERAGRAAATCQGCHMSTYPGICEAIEGGGGAAAAGGGDPEGPSNAESRSTSTECPPGTRFVARAPGSWPRGRVADGSAAARDVTTHYFSGVDVPLSDEFAAALIDEPSVDTHGIPTGARRRRDLLLRHTFRFGLGAARRAGGTLEIPVEIENTGAGHRVPAGFSQEREFWVHLAVKDERGRAIYEVGRVDRRDEDLHDKEFLRVSTRPDQLDGKGRPEGLFGADVRDGIDAPRWRPPPILGGASFRGRGLINFQNGFLRCVRCAGVVAGDGSCQPGPGQGLTRADRFEDGDYDLDTGECRSNLTGMNAFFETYYPVGALDASRGVVKGPDAIIDTRSVPPGVPIRYTYELDAGGRRGPLRVEARLLFRAFPPFLIRAFAAYEREQARRGLRPSGPLVTDEMLARLEVVELARAEAEIR